MAAALGAFQDAQENLNAFRENTEAQGLLGHGYVRHADTDHEQVRPANESDSAPCPLS